MPQAYLTFAKQIFHIEDISLVEEERISLKRPQSLQKISLNIYGALTLASVLLNQSTSEISRRCGMWNVCLAANVKYRSFVAMWNKICPRSRSEHFTRVIAFHTPQAYFTCPQGQISLKKALAIASAFFSEICPCGQVKYACGVWNAITRVKCSLRERGQILFHIATKERYFTFAARQTFHIPHRRDISLVLWLSSTEASVKAP